MAVQPEAHAARRGDADDTIEIAEPMRWRVAAHLGLQPQAGRIAGEDDMVHAALAKLLGKGGEDAVVVDEQLAAADAQVDPRRHALVEIIAQAPAEVAGGDMDVADVRETEHQGP